VVRSRIHWAAAAVVLLAAVVAAGLVLGGRAPARSPAPPPARAVAEMGITSLTVSGNRLVDQHGSPVRLLGFNSSGAEYACMEGWGIFDLPGDDPAHVPDAVLQAMAGWTGANTIRVPLNEQCWLGLGVPPEYGGAAYQRAIADYVGRLRSSGFAVVLDLHRSAPGDAQSLHQEQMPDRDHSPEFWRQVATAYKDDPAVVFDVFNEPWPYDEVDTPRAWQCWRDGGCQLTSQNGGQTYTAAGMAELIAAIRSTGARNPVAVGGIHWAETLDRWLEYRPADPLRNELASFHNYAYNRFCKDASCYDTVLAKVAAAVPLFAGEVGPDTVDQRCTAASVGHTGFSERILDWLDAHGASYTPWSWNAWGDCYSLVTAYDGTPTPIWGQEVRARLERNAR
jgi:hypothetical protein